MLQHKVSTAKSGIGTVSHGHNPRPSADGGGKEGEEGYYKKKKKLGETTVNRRAFTRWSRLLLDCFSFLQLPGC